MAKKPIRRKDPDPHIVFVDTSTLWFEDRSLAVDPKFDDFWKEYVRPFSLRLKIPKVVIGELEYQHATTARKQLTRISDSLEKLNAATRKSYTFRPTEPQTRRAIRSKFSSWAKTCSAELLEVPTSRIQWDTIVNQSIWRLQPFSSDGDREKGFRDAMILETIVDWCGRNSLDARIAFLCRDRLLRETAEARLSKDPRFSAYERIADFKSYLDLTSEQLQEQFIRSIIKKASTKFFAQGDFESLYIKEGIRKKLLDQYAEYFENPDLASSSAFGSVLMGVASWAAKSQGVFWIGSPEFVSLENDNEYSWKSSVTYVQLFDGEETGASYLVTEFPGVAESVRSENILLLRFVVSWKAKIGKDGRFWNSAYTSDELVEKEFRPATDDDRREWNLLEGEG